MNDSNEFILAEIEMLKFGAKTCEDYARIYPNIQYLESLLEESKKTPIERLKEKSITNDTN